MSKTAKTPKPPDLNDEKREQGSSFNPMGDKLVEIQPHPVPRDQPPTKGARRMEDIMPERINWLWPGYLAAGKLSLLIGDPGIGKSTLTHEIVARFSRGEPLPGTTTTFSPLNCGLCCREDDPADTIRPRLDAARADVSLVFVLDDVQTLPNDLVQLEANIRQHALKLVVIDPIVAFLSGKHDSYRDQDVRLALTPLVEVAQRTGCAVLAVMHLNKRQGVSALYRAGGSIGFVGLARTAMMLAKDRDDPERRVLAQLKNNLAKERTAHWLRLVTAPGHEVAAIEWGEQCDLSAESPVVRREAACALTPLAGEPTVRDALRKCLKDPDGDVQKAARAALAPLAAAPR